MERAYTPCELLQRLDEEAGCVVEPLVDLVRDDRLERALRQQLTDRLQDLTVDQPSRDWVATFSYTVYYARALKLSLSTFQTQLMRTTGLVADVAAQTRRFGSTAVEVASLTVRHKTSKDTAASVVFVLECVVKGGLQQ